MKKINLVNYIKTHFNSAQFLCCLVVSLIAGILIGFSQVGINYLFKGIDAIIDNSVTNKIILLPYILGSICGFVLITFIVKLFKLSYEKGSLCFQKNYLETDVKWYEFPLIFLVLGISLFAGLPTCWIETFELSTNFIDKKVRKYSQIETDDDYILINKSAVLGASLASPLAGLAYAFETKKKFDFMFIVKTVTSIAVMTSISLLIRFFFRMEGWSFFRIIAFDNFSWKSLLVYFVLGLLIALISLIVIFFTKFIDKKINSNKRGALIKKIITICLLILCFTLLFFGIFNEWKMWQFASYDGLRLFKYLNKYNTDWVLIIIAFAWLLYVIFIPNSNLNLGKTLPTIIFGALLGIIVYKHGLKEKFISEQEMSMVIGISMFSFYGVVNKKPITAVALIFTISVWTTMIYEFVPIVLSILPGFFVVKASKFKTIDEYLIDNN